MMKHTQKDQRVKVEDNLAYPFYCIGILISEYKTNDDEVQKSQGTATLVAPNVILTAAHNVCWKDYYDKTIRRSSKTYFYPGTQGNMNLGVYEVKQPYIYPIQYEDDDKKQPDCSIPHNWAFLVLEKKVEKMTPIPMILDYPQTNSEIGVFGYPSDLKKNYLYGSTGYYRLKKQNEDIIEHGLGTGPGIGGAPILLMENGKVEGIIGVHTTATYSEENRFHKFGCRLRIEQFAKVQEEMKIKHGFKIEAEPIIKQQK